MMDFLYRIMVGFFTLTFILMVYWNLKKLTPVISKKYRHNPLISAAIIISIHTALFVVFYLFLKFVLK